MSTPEHLDGETWEPWDSDEDWWLALDDGTLTRLGFRRQADLRTAPGLLDEQRDADFDDEETRP